MHPIFDSILQKTDQDDLGLRRVSFLMAVVLLPLWTLWLWRAPLPMRIDAVEAKLERPASARPLTVGRSARVIWSAVELGRRVQPGEVLVRLEDGPLQQEIDAAANAVQDARSTVEFLDRRQGALKERMQARELERTKRNAADRSAGQVLAIRIDAAESRLQRRRRLLDEGIVSSADIETLASELEELKAQRAAHDDLSSSRSASDQARQIELAALLADTRASRVAAENQLATSLSILQRLRRQQEDFQLASPVAGFVQSHGSLEPGTWAEAGDTLVTIVPDGPLRIEAELPLTAIGRLQAGQKAWIVLPSHPATRFGRLEAVTVSVGMSTDGTAARTTLEPIGPWPELDGAVGLPVRVEIETGRHPPIQWLAGMVDRHLSSAENKR